MTQQSSLSLTMLQAIELFRAKPPEQWSSEELAAFRARLQESPILVSSLGGQDAVDRRLAEVSAALLIPAKATPVRDIAPAAIAPPPRSKILWRTGEAAVFLALLAGGCAAFYFLWRKADCDPATAVRNPATAEAAPPSKATPEKRIEDGDGANTEEPAQPEKVDENLWQGWTIAAEREAQKTMKDDWDLTDASNPQPIKLLTTEGGPVHLSRRIKIAQAPQYLELNVRPVSAVSRPGHIVVSVADTNLADALIGSGRSKWPLYVSLEKYAGQEVSIRVVYTPDEPGQKIAWWSLALVDTQRHEPRAESPLVEGLASKNLKTRLFAAKRAGMGGDLAAIPALTDALHDSDVRIRQAAVAALLRFDDPAARNALRDTLKADLDTPLRIMIAVSFSKRPQSGDIPSLLVALKDPNHRLREITALTLAGLKDPSVTTELIQMLGDSNRNVREGAAGALSLRKGSAVENTFLPLLTGDADTTLKTYATIYFQSNPTPQAIAPLAALLQSDEIPLRQQVVMSLSSFNQPEATKALASALEDSDGNVRELAAVTLSRRKGPAADEAMLAALRGNPDISVKQHAAAHFQQFPNREATGPLVDALSAKQIALRRHAIRALGRSPDDAAIAALGKVLHDPDISVRRAATMALKQSSHPKASAVLKQKSAPM